MKVDCYRFEERFVRGFLRYGVMCYVLALAMSMYFTASAIAVTPGCENSHFGVSKQFTFQDGMSVVVKKLDLMKIAGVRWRRPNLNWRKYEEKPEWYDEAISAAYHRGACLVLMIDGWYGVLPDQGIDDRRTLESYKSFLADVVERYDGDGIRDAPGSPTVRYYQIGNEIGGPKHFWRRKGGQAGPASEYVRLLKLSYETIKAKNPEVQVVLGSLGGEDRKNYLKGVLEAGGGKYFDVLDFHIYHNYDDFYRIMVPEDRVGRFMKLMLNHGVRKPIWVTESAEASAGRKGLSEERQAENLVKRNVVLLSEGVERVFTHFFDKRPGSGQGKEANRGLLRYDGTPKLAFHAYKTMIGKMDYCRSVHLTSRGNAKVAHCLFEQKADVWVVWGAKGALVDLGMKRVRMTDIYGSERFGDGRAISVTDSPLFIELAQE